MRKQTWKAKPAKRRVIVVKGNKGGTGKTFTSLAMASAIQAQGHRPPVFVHIESEDRCGRFFKGEDNYHYLAVAQETLQEIEQDPSSVYNQLDRLSEIAQQSLASDRSVIVDLPANFDRGFASYVREQAASGPLGGGNEVLTIAVTHGRTDAMIAAGNSVALMREALPHAAVVVLFNNIDPSAVRGPRDPLFLHFGAKAGEAGANEVLHVERLMSPTLLRAGDDLNIPISRLIIMNGEAWGKIGINAFRAAREAARATEYVDQLRGLLDRHTY